MTNTQHAMQVVRVVGSARGVNIHVTCVQTVPSVTHSRLNVSVQLAGWDPPATNRVLR